MNYPFTGIPIVDVIIAGAIMASVLATIVAMVAAIVLVVSIYDKRAWAGWAILLGIIMLFLGLMVQVSKRKIW